MILDVICRLSTHPHFNSGVLQFRALQFLSQHIFHVHINALYLLVPCSLSKSFLIFYFDHSESGFLFQNLQKSGETHAVTHRRSPQQPTALLNSSKTHTDMKEPSASLHDLVAQISTTAFPLTFFHKSSVPSEFSTDVYGTRKHLLLPFWYLQI